MLMFNRSVPLAWRSSRCLQIGIDDPVLIDGLSAADRELIELIKMGISPELLSDKSSQLGMAHERLESLLSLLEEAGALVPRVQLHTSPVTHQVDAIAQARQACPSEISHAFKRQRVLCVGPLAPELSTMLTACGLSASSGSLSSSTLQPGTLVAFTSVWVPDLMGARALHESDTPHVSACIQQESATVTHVIQPSFTPCIACLTHYWIDADDEWLAGWKSLREQAPSPRRVDPLLAWSALVEVARTVRQHVLEDFTVPHIRRVSMTGETTSDVAQFHTACDCRVSQLVTDLTTSTTS